MTFTQARSTVRIGAPLLQNVVTARRSLPDEAVRDLLVALVTLRYTQSNSVCLAWHGQAVGVGAGQQSRLHCTRLAADKADLWRLRRHEKALALPFLPQVGRPARDNATAQYLGGDADALLADGAYSEIARRTGRSRSPPPSGRTGWPRRRTSRSAATRSSRLRTASSARRKAASPSSRSRAAPCATRR